MKAAGVRPEVWLLAAAIALGYVFGASAARSDLNFSSYTRHDRNMS